MLQRVLKPWYLYRPSQIPRRLWAGMFPPAAGYRELRTSWGVDICADPAKIIGQNIVVAGMYDLPLSELFARLIKPGDLVVDVGANVGYMTLLAAVLAGRNGDNGEVVAFEPHPELFSVLKRNVAGARERFQLARTDLHNAAVGASAGLAQLNVPPQFGDNDGISYIAESGREGRGTIPVSVESLDDVLGDRHAALLKVDVEGFEVQVFLGAARCLQSHRIKHVLFEEHHVENARTVRMLQDCGYRVFSVGWSLAGLVIAEVSVGSLAKGLEPSNFVATIQPAELFALCEPRGWLVLKKLTRRKSPIKTSIHGIDNKRTPHTRTRNLG